MHQIHVRKDCYARQCYYAPKTIDQVIGQEHPGRLRIIRRMEANRLSSMIHMDLGYQAVSSAIAGTTKYASDPLNATVDSKNVSEIAEAKFSGGLVLLLGEIHRLDKTNKTSLLPLLENGLVSMIGATTENPFFSVLQPFVAVFRFLIRTLIQ